MIIWALDKHSHPGTKPPPSLSVPTRKSFQNCKKCLAAVGNALTLCFTPSWSKEFNIPNTGRVLWKIQTTQTGEQPILKVVLERALIWVAAREDLPEAVALAEALAALGVGLPAGARRGRAADVLEDIVVLQEAQVMVDPQAVTQVPVVLQGKGGPQVKVVVEQVGLMGKVALHPEWALRAALLEDHKEALPGMTLRMQGEWEAQEPVVRLLRNYFCSFSFRGGRSKGGSPLFLFYRVGVFT